MLYMKDKAKGVGRMSADTGALPECDMNTLMTPVSPPSGCAAVGKVEPELFGLLGKALILDSTVILRFVVHSACWLHSMVLHGRSSPCSNGNCSISNSGNSCGPVS